ncbi:MAG TPA: hypothetical protein VMS22_12235 [Candidatus Eisenbacteria bacterium]|nr:hypothetical protein [Candidatus Eisenbacteria bacterium]
MKAFSNPGYMLAFARIEVRVAYTAFLVLVVIGMLTMGAFQVGHIGPLPSDIATYFLGGERAGVMTFPKAYREMVELTHAHAFVMGLVYLVLAHLLIATTAPPFVKKWAVIGGFAGLVGDVVGVWLIRYVSPRFAYGQVGAWAAEWVSFVAFVYYPMRDMWFASEDDGDDD